MRVISTRSTAGRRAPSSERSHQVVGERARDRRALQRDEDRGRLQLDRSRSAASSRCPGGSSDRLDQQHVLTRLVEGEAEDAYLDDHGGSSGRMHLHGRHHHVRLWPRHGAPGHGLVDSHATRLREQPGCPLRTERDVKRLKPVQERQGSSSCSFLATPTTGANTWCWSSGSRQCAGPSASTPQSLPPSRASSTAPAAARSWRFRRS